MRRCLKDMASLIIVATICFLAVSCNKEIDFGFKELCFYHPHTAPVRINVDWSRFRHIEQPTGMTVNVWPHNDDEDMSNFLTHNLNYITVDLKAGKFDTFVFNQSINEYGTIEFYNLENIEQAEARAKQIESKWYATKNPGTKVGTEPEWLAIDCLRDVEVTQDMVEMAEAEFLEGLKKSLTNYDVGTLTPTSIIKSVDVYVHLENVQYLRSALGAIDDMAEGCYIATKATTEGVITHEIESWQLLSETGEPIKTTATTGVLKATISTFGVPSGHTGLAEENLLVVKLLLADNKTILQVDFPIGDQLADLNTYDGTQCDESGKPIWPEVHVTWPEPLPIVIPVDGDSGGFNVGVGDWGEEESIELPLM